MARRVYFAFDYEDVRNFRVNQVRNSNIITSDDYEVMWADASIWEDEELHAESEVQGLIDKEVEGTSVTAVLTGNRTYGRKWVRYELVKSLARGNGLMNIFIHNCKGKDGNTGAKGHNPLEFVRCGIEKDNPTVHVQEYNIGAWASYRLLPSFPLSNLKYGFPRDQWFQLHQLFRSYDWTDNGGYVNFGSWVSDSADQVGR